jgi:hypothetical protein
MNEWGARTAPVAPKRFPPSRINAAVLLIFAAALGQGAVSAAEEWRVRDLEALQERPGANALSVLPGNSADALSPRAAALRAMVRTRAAIGANPESRAQLLALAQKDAARAVAGRPNWGQAWVTETFVRQADQGSGSPAALAAFRRSYAENGYLPGAAEWRLRYALRNWNALDPATRAKVIDESRWVIQLGQSQAVHVYVLTGGTPIWERISGQKRAPHILLRRP